MKKIFIILLLFINIFILSSCYNPPELSEDGFSYDMQEGIVIAARAKSKKYNMNEPIVFDFYFGYEKELFDIYERYDETFERVCFALYFGPVGYIERFQQFPSYTNKDIVYEPIIDFRKIPGFVREITLEEFDSEEYYVEMPAGKSKTFHHSEEMTIPREYIDSHTELVCLSIVEISYNENMGYDIIEFGTLEIRIEYKNCRLKFNAI